MIEYFFSFFCLQRQVMAYNYSSSSIYVSLHVSGSYTTVHIRQHMDTLDVGTGKTLVNRDGLFLTMDEFSSLVYQLKAIEREFELNAKDQKQVNILPPPPPPSPVEPSTLVKIGKRKSEPINESSTTPAKKVKKLDDLIQKWYAEKVKDIIQKRLKDDCFSCLMQIPDEHICQTHINDTSHKYLDKYFPNVLDGLDKELAISELKLSTIEGRKVKSIIKKKNWRDGVKSMIQNESV